MIIAIGAALLMGTLVVVYFSIKQIGRQAERRKRKIEAFEDAIKVKKRDIKHSADPISDVDEQLLKETRD